AAGRRIERALDAQCGADRAGRGIEQRQHRIAGHVDHLPVIGLDLRFEDASGGIQRRHGCTLVRFHEPRVARAVSGENGCEPLLTAVAHRFGPLPPSPCTWYPMRARGPRTLRANGASRAGYASVGGRYKLRLFSRAVASNEAAAHDTQGAEPSARATILATASPSSRSTIRRSMVSRTR